MLLLDRVLSRFSFDQSSAQVVDGLFVVFIIFLSQKSIQGVVHSSYIEQEKFFQNKSYQDRRLGEVLFDILESLLASFIPYEGDAFHH